MSRERDDADPDWSDFLRSFRRHTAADGGRLRTDLMRRLARRPAYRDAILPPDGAEEAWRLLYGVPREALADLGAGPKPPVRGVARGVRYLVGAHRVSSWTLDSGLFSSDMPGFFSTAEWPGAGSFAVVLRAPIAQRPRRFWLNPDVLYGLSGSDFAYQREVVSVGPLAGCDVAWAEGSDEYDGPALEELAEWCVGAIEGG